MKKAIKIHYLLLTNHLYLIGLRV